MIPMYSPTQSRHIRILAGGVLCLFISACAHQQSEPSPPTEAEICQSLDYAIKQAASDFKDIRLNVTPDYVMNRWDTKPIFPETDCDVFDWGGGRFTYNCLWKESDQATAKNNYEANVKLGSRCLGPDWHASEQPGKTGQTTIFSKPGSDTKIQLRYFQERAPATLWQTSVSIGRHVTPDAR
ncbi:hypothetical protein [Methylococcus mesophilus]|uniref:hypothetical protein n=1 Tax=Methylococcus mesophilus TaxID=2993564 RepID=UPI00224B3ECF|nr:hypothetical protein [Methylococcus mesophilus]UZR29495.1 hypothetical protein OOT43_02350 [Methylococcus mesophilus]